MKIVQKHLLIVAFFFSFSLYAADTTIQNEPASEDLTTKCLNSQACTNCKVLRENRSALGQQFEVDPSDNRYHPTVYGQNLIEILVKNSNQFIKFLMEGLKATSLEGTSPIPFFLPMVVKNSNALEVHSEVTTNSSGNITMVHPQIVLYALKKILQPSKTIAATEQDHEESENEIKLLKKADENVSGLVNALCVIFDTEKENNTERKLENLYSPNSRESKDNRKDARDLRMSTPLIPLIKARIEVGLENFVDTLKNNRKKITAVSILGFYAFLYSKNRYFPGSELLNPAFRLATPCVTTSKNLFIAGKNLVITNTAAEMLSSCTGSIKSGMIKGLDTLFPKI